MDIRDEEKVRLKQENEELKELLRGALERISELERRLDLNSTNSSKPPSSDGLKRPHRIKSERVSSGKQSGGQKGHEGQTLEMSQHPHYIEVYQVKECDGCGSNLELVASNKNKVRQVFDLLPIELVVTEHRAQEKSCPHCHKLVQAKFPESVNAPVQYGERVRSVITYFGYQHFIPEERVKRICEDVLGFSIASASIATFGAEQA